MQKMKELVELGRRIKAERIAQGRKQAELADQAAVSVDSLSSMENGRSISTRNLARILQALGFVDALENLVPAPVPSPLELQKLEGKQRQRVR